MSEECKVFLSLPAAGSATRSPGRMQRPESQSSCVAVTPRWDTRCKFEELTTEILKENPFFGGLIQPSFDLMCLSNSFAIYRYRISG